jgi:hypothetical protein
MGLGYFFSEAITSLALSAARLGRMLGIVAVAGGYILVKYLRRRLFLQRLRMGEDRSRSCASKTDLPNWPSGTVTTAHLLHQRQILSRPFAPEDQLKRFVKATWPS